MPPLHTSIYTHTHTHPHKEKPELHNNIIYREKKKTQKGQEKIQKRTRKKKPVIHHALTLQEKKDEIYVTKMRQKETPHPEKDGGEKTQTGYRGGKRFIGNDKVEMNHFPSRFDEILPADPHPILPNPHEVAIWITIILFIPTPIPLPISIIIIGLIMLATFTLPSLF